MLSPTSRLPETRLPCASCLTSDLTGLSEADRRRLVLDPMRPLEFGHTLGDQMGGQLDAGFVLNSFFEDRFGDPDHDPLSRYLDTFIATRAVKP